MRPNRILLFAMGLLAANSGYAAIGDATVVVIRGSAKTSAGIELKEKDKVPAGSTVITSARSFVRLLFADNTQLNVGPDTTMMIESSKPGQPSLVDLVGGEIRAKVTKDPLLNHDANAPVTEKMIVKTKTAAMGIRGTDFNVSFNQQNNMTALITFEGNVAMAKLEAGKNPFDALHQDKGVQSVGAGQFSGVQPDQPHASIPVKISPAQLETLKGNPEFKGLGEQAQKQNVLASPIPPGVDPKAFASGSEKSLAAEVAKTVGASNLEARVVAEKGPSAKNFAPPEGFVNKKTGDYAPRAGGFIDLASGRYVPPPAGSTFDANTGVFVPPRAMGSVDPSTGMYVPPKGVTMDPVNGFVAEAPHASDGTRAIAGTTPSAAMVQLAAVLNTASSPTASTQVVTTNNSLSAGGGVVAQIATVQQNQSSSPSTIPPPSTNAPSTSAPPSPTAPSSSSSVNPPPPGAPPPPPSGTTSTDSQPPPPPPPNTEPDPQQSQPVSDNCASNHTCGGVTPTPGPTTTGVNFKINVTD